MADFRYTAQRGDGQTIDGAVEAPSVEAAYADLRRQGLKPLSLDPARAGRQAVQDRAVPLGAQLSWATRMETMLDAGLSIDEALTILKEGSGKRDPMVAISAALLGRVRAGETFADAVVAVGVFAPSVTGLLLASERTSDVAGAMAAIATLLNRTQEMRRTLVQALVYPAFLGVVAVGSLILMLGFVVPQFEPLLEGAEALPAMAEGVLAASQSMRAHSTPLLILGIFVIGGAVLAARHPAAGAVAGRVGLSVPLIGPILGDLAMAGLLRNLGTFLRADIPVLEALGLAAEAAPTSPYADALSQARERVSQGERLSAILVESGRFPSDVTDMLRAGERSAAVPPMLLKISEMAEARARAGLKQMLTLLEPAIILVIGVIIGGIVFSIFQAILSVNDIVL